MAATVFDMRLGFLVDDMFKGREESPLLPDMEAWRKPCDNPDLPSIDDDPFIQKLKNSGPVRRLKKIGFLGAIEYMRHGTGKEPHRRRHNRYEHSVQVARLALLYARIRELSEHDARILTASGLLHDVGHGPLSHTLEPIFDKQFDVNHHKSGNDILHGRSSPASDIPDIMKRNGVDLDEVSKMIEGTSESPHAFLFSSPINLDTIEGITRSASIFFNKQQPNPCTRIVRKVAESDALPTQALDEFWELKHKIYNSSIHGSDMFRYDGLAQSYMTENIDEFEPRDFLLHEEQLKRRHERLFTLLKEAKNPRNLAARISSGMMNYDVEMVKRSFHVDESVKLDGFSDLERRYTQTRKSASKPLKELLACGEHVA